MPEQMKKKIGRNDIIVETGKIAKQASGAVTIQLGGTVVLATCVSAKEAKEGVNFLPLFVEYQEKTYAAGKIPGGFFKREGRPSEKEILTARLIDRPIRPLFPENMANEIQIVALVLSSDSENDSDVLAVNAASAALLISDIPFEGPVACVRVGMINGEFVLNPTFKELEGSELDLVVADNNGEVIMMEASANELDENKIHEAIDFAKKPLKELRELQKELAAKCGKKKRDDITVHEAGKELLDKIRQGAEARLKEIISLSRKEDREQGLDKLTGELLEKFVSEEKNIEGWQVKQAIEKIEKEVVRKSIVKDKKRVDNRAFDELRPIECVVGFLPRAHGSGLFTRGQTQSLCAATLGTSADEQMIDALEGTSQKSFMLHYNFPAFSVGEVRPFRGPGRREIGHGALAEKSLKPLMPSSEQFPYTVRLVSDILESNGSSSMASVCAGSLALMDAGVPVKASVAGVAIGLVKDSGEHILLTDIAGVEDHYGDMDFKVAGTKKGITAIQLDLKINGLADEALKEALRRAKKARLEVIAKMDAVIATPKESISDYAPRIVNMKINPEKIKDVIGPGGRTIKNIIKDTGVSIDIEDDGTVQVASNDSEALNKAIDIIKGLSAEVEPGQIYEGTITRILNFGAFCEILPGKEGLIHISEIADKYVKDVNSELSIGDKVRVKVIEIDAQGRINLSRKQALQTEDEKNQSANKEEGNR